MGILNVTPDSFADGGLYIDPVAAEAVLHLKGTQLRAKEVSKDAKHAINLVADNMERQVKRHRDKRRGRRESRSAAEVARTGEVTVEEAPSTS